MYSFQVRDSGIGIPAAAIRDIFEPFQQAHGETRGGSGLGLAIAARHVQLMGGELKCNSAEGIGSTFTFKLSLPAMPKTRSESNSISMMLGDVRIARGQQISALVVDDVLENRKFLGSVLLAAGCEVHTCASGVEALELVERFSPQIAFIDMMMPGMDGHQTAQHLVARYGDAGPRLVATTAAALTHEQQQLRAEGFADVLIKPLLIERIYLSMSTLLGITFEPSDSALSRNPDASTHDAEDPGFPSELRSQLREAAQRYSITDIRRVIGEIEQLGPEYQSIVSQLKDLMRRYDLQGVARFAATLKEGDVAVAIGSPA
jgi:CheY-like chemotaxis protein